MGHFMNKRIRLRRCDNSTKIEIDKDFVFEEDNLEIKYFDDDYFTTLKDISIIIFEMAPSGVVHQLANELSKRNGFYSPKQYEQVLLEIFKEYKNLSDEDALISFDNTPNLNLEK